MDRFPHMARPFRMSIPPTRTTLIGEFQSSGADDVSDAVSAAAEAWKTWRLTPAPKRAEILYRTGEILSQRKEQHAQEMTREMGKVLSETRGDVQEAIDTAYYMAGEGRRLFGQTTPSELKSKFAMSIRMPVGVVGMIAPWNFPMAIPSWKLFPALVCGNTCVIKPAEDTPLSTFNLVQALIDAGLPPGVVNIVTGYGPDAGAPIVSHPGIRAISFTGSSEVGRIVGQTAAANFKPLLARDGRQERHDRPRRRQPRSCPRRSRLGSLRHHRPALQPPPAASSCTRRSRQSSPRGWSPAPTPSR